MYEMRIQCVPVCFDWDLHIHQIDFPIAVNCSSEVNVIYNRYKANLVTKGDSSGQRTYDGQIRRYAAKLRRIQL